MGYGGPRVEFYTANQYANHAAAIQREDAARVRSIVHRRTSTPESERLRQREEAFRAYEAEQAAAAAEARAAAVAALEARERQEERQRRRLATKGRHGSLTAAEATARRTRTARLHALAAPRQRPDPPAHDTSCGCAMHSVKGRTVYPVGRNNAPYTPGVDRDRVVPARPQLSGDGAALPPWMGSYSSHHGATDAARQAARADAAYYSGVPAVAPRSAAAEAAKQQTLREMTASYEKAQQERQQQLLMSSADGEAVQATAVSAAPEDEEEKDNNCHDEETASVFSHGSSNGPICATGNMHISTTSTKASVQLHLSRYGGAMTAPRPPRSTAQTPAEELTLPELSHRLVKMQAPHPKRQ